MFFRSERRRSFCLFFLFCSLFIHSLAFAQEQTSVEALAAQADALQKELDVLKKQMKVLTESHKNLENKGEKQWQTFTYPAYFGGLPITTSPYLGKQPEFNGSDLIVNMSVMNLDISLMEQRNDMDKVLHKEWNIAIPEMPLMMFSGVIQPIAIAQKPDSRNGLSGSLSLYTLMLDSAIIMNPWVEGFLSFTSGSSAYVARVQEVSSVSADPNVTVDDAFVNIGNLDKTPFYVTAGQVYLPFGEYTTNMVTWPMIMNIGQVRIPAAILGYSSGENNGFSGTLFTYNANTTLGGTGAGGGSVAYQLGNDKINATLAGSMISNIADAGGMQDTGSDNNTFDGFSLNEATEAINQLPGYDFNAVLNVGSYSFLAEYISAIRPFPVDVLSYNNEGAKPSGGNLEASRTFEWFHRPASFAIGYGWTNESLALNLSQQRFITTLNISWWRSTIESLEFRHDIDYGASDSASGIGSSNPNVGSGDGQNTLTASLAVYF